MRNRFHSLCPYFAMFPETFAETWIERLTKPRAIVLDPFCGRGTAPFQALLMKRQAIGNDVNPVAYCITKAKTNAPTAASVRRRITQLEKVFDPRAFETKRKGSPEFFHFAYSKKALRQLLFLRETLDWHSSDVDCMIAALILGSLHGEMSSPTYLSNQMPRTISTKPDYSVRYWKQHDLRPPERDVFEILRNRVTFRYESEPPALHGVVLNHDMRELPRVLGPKNGKIRCVITSPPYLDITNFEEDQWLRLWFLKGATHPTYRAVSKDDRHRRADSYWDLIADMWRMLGRVLDRKADIVIRIGGRNFDPEITADRLAATSLFSQRRAELVHSETSEILRRQTDSFRPGSKGCLVESDYHFRLN